MSDRALSCQDVAGEILADYHDGVLPTAERSKVDDHLALCRTCMNAVRTYCATPKIVKEALWTDPPAHSEGSLLEYLRKHGAL